MTMLSQREREVLHLTAQGDTCARVGERLSISHRTVRFHIDRAKKKLSAKNIPNLIAIAIRDGFVSLEREQVTQ